MAAREEIVSLVAERLPSHYGVDPVSDIQVFAPVYRGELGIDSLNLALREALNADGQPVRGGRLRIGDKLMMTGRNLHELGLMNGTLLRLLDEVSGSEDDESALILAAEDTIFRLPPEESERLRLAYACSVHRGQGIELPGRGDRRSPGRRCVLPAARDALHRRHASEDRDRDRRDAQRDREGGTDTRHGAQTQPAGRAAGWTLRRTVSPNLDQSRMRCGRSRTTHDMCVITSPS